MIRSNKLRRDTRLLVCVAIVAAPCLGRAALGRFRLECGPEAIPEEEPDCGYPEDSTNGGCFSSPHVWSPIECGQVTCGTSRLTWGAGSDLDVYELYVTQLTAVRWSVVAEFPCGIHIVDGSYGCYGELLASDVAPAGEQAVASAPVSPGIYWLSVLPDSDVDIACGAQYQAILTCELVSEGACCLPDYTCQELPELTCAGEGGTYRGDGSRCADIICPNGPGACCLAEGGCLDGLGDGECEGMGAAFYGGGTVCAEVECCLALEPPFVMESEPLCYDGYFDTYNGGCDPPVDEFITQWINCGRVYGHSGTYLGPDGSPRRDMDLYQLDFWVRPFSPTRFRWRVTPTFPAEVGMTFVNWYWGPPICDWNWTATATTGACRTATIDVTMIDWTDSYWCVYVRPQAGAQVTAGAPYVAELTCAPFDDPYCGYQRRGDANCDGAVNGFDIDPFVVALARGRAAWEAEYSIDLPFPAVGACGYLCVNDCNADGAVNAFDIDPFVELLVGG